MFYWLVGSRDDVKNRPGANNPKGNFENSFRTARNGLRILLTRMKRQPPAIQGVVNYTTRQCSGNVNVNSVANTDEIERKAKE